MNPPRMITKVTGHGVATVQGAGVRYLDEIAPHGPRPSRVLSRVDIDAIIRFLGRKRRRRFRPKPGQ